MNRVTITGGRGDREELDKRGENRKMVGYKVGKIVIIHTLEMLISVVKFVKPCLIRQSWSLLILYICFHIRRWLLSYVR